MKTHKKDVPREEAHLLYWWYGCWWLFHEHFLAINDVDTMTGLAHALTGNGENGGSCLLLIHERGIDAVIRQLGEAQAGAFAVLA